jgi:uncharacterized Zn finger protein (UPF0148 family)
MAWRKCPHCQSPFFESKYIGRTTKCPWCKKEIEPERIKLKLDLEPGSDEPV